MRKFNRSYLGRNAEDIKKYLLTRLSDEELKSEMPEDGRDRFVELAIRDGSVSGVVSLVGADIQQIPPILFTMRLVELDVSGNPLQVVSRPICVVTELEFPRIQSIFFYI